jgi:2-C-methyl-D-erythritol 4-phosphate cytidylyltransferase/2-C-methyl-D-erythritol 2,4-cyclodiphosphate synthase
MGDGDIGSHFPPSEAKWKGKDSAFFLEYAVQKLKDAGGKLRHIDLIIICEMPKITPHRDAIRERLAELCDIGLHRVSVKATTTESLGFTGRREGIAAQAAVTIEYPDYD